MSFRDLVDHQRQGQLVPQVGQNSYQPVISTTRSVPPVSQERHFWPMQPVVAKIRRSRNTAKKSFKAIKLSTCNFLHANTNGFKSKAESINQIISEESTDVNSVDRNKSLYQVSHKHKRFSRFFCCERLDHV